MRFPFHHVLLSILFALLAFLLTACGREVPAPSRFTNAGFGGISQELAAQVAQIEAAEQKMNETVWAKEILAQE